MIPEDLQIFRFPQGEFSLRETPWQVLHDLLVENGQDGSAALAAELGPKGQLPTHAWVGDDSALRRAEWVYDGYTLFEPPVATVVSRGRAGLWLLLSRTRVGNWSEWRGRGDGAVRYCDMQEQIRHVGGPVVLPYGSTYQILPGEPVTARREAPGYYCERQ